MGVRVLNEVWFVLGCGFGGGMFLIRFCFVGVFGLLLGLVSSQQMALAVSNQELFRQAGSLETQGKVEDAIAAYKQIAERGQAGKAAVSVSEHDSFSLRSRLRLARLRLSQGRVQDADAVYQLALSVSAEQAKSDPELMVDMDDLAESYSALAKKGKDRKAMLLRALELRKKIDPDHPRVRDSYRELTSYLILYGELAEAERYIKISIDRQKNAVSPKKLIDLTSDQILLMSIYIVQKQWGKTEVLAKEVLAKAENQPALSWSLPGLRFTLAKCYGQRRRFDLSDIEYRKAIDLAKRNPSTAGQMIQDCLKGIEENKLSRKRGATSLSARRELQ